MVAERDFAESETAVTKVNGIEEYKLVELTPVTMFPDADKTVLPYFNVHPV